MVALRLGRTRKKTLRASTASEALDDMLDVFTSDAFADRAGLTRIDAMATLKEAAASGNVVEAVQDRWMRLPSLSYSGDGKGMPGGRSVNPVYRVDLKHRLNALWGDAERRISHLSALSKAGVPLKNSWVITVSGPTVDADAARRLGIDAVAEQAETISVGAERVNEHTWLSTPARAVLECLREPSKVSDHVEAAAQVLFLESIASPTEVISFARQMDWEHALRRLASIAKGMQTCDDSFPRKQIPYGFLPKSQAVYIELKSTSASAEWIGLTDCTDASNLAPAHKDTDHRVLWWSQPEEFLEDILR